MPMRALCIQGVDANEGIQDRSCMAMVGLERSTQSRAETPGEDPKGTAAALGMGLGTQEGLLDSAQSVAGHGEHHPARQSFCKGDFVFFLADYRGSDDGPMRWRGGQGAFPSLPAPARTPRRTEA